MSEHTKAPWEWRKVGTSWVLWGAHGMRPIVLDCARKGMQGAGFRVRTMKEPTVMVDFDPDHPDAKLIEAAPDHAMLAFALCSGNARWEPLGSDDRHGEVCIGGLRHYTELDEFGVPTLTPGIRSAIAKARGEPCLNTTP